MKLLETLESFLSTQNNSYTYIFGGDGHFGSLLGILLK